MSDDINMQMLIVMFNLGLKYSEKCQSQFFKQQRKAGNLHNWEPENGISAIFGQKITLKVNQ